MPLNLPWDASSYTVCLFANAEAAGGPHAWYDTMRVSRRQLQAWGREDEQAFRRAVLEAFRRASPGHFDDFDSDDVAVTFADSALSFFPAWAASR